MTAEPDALRLVPEMNAGAATPASDLRDYIMNPNIPKSEAEWWAGKQIAELEAKIALLAAAPAVQPAAGREEIARLAIDFVTEQSEGEWGDDLIKRDADKLTARILAAISTPAKASGEPVVWGNAVRRVAFADGTPVDGPWSLADAVSVAMAKSAVPPQFEVQPLYAHPPAQASESGGAAMSALDEALIYIEKLGENIERNDVDMHLDTVERPFSFAQTMRSRFAALSAPQAATGEGEQS